MDARALRCLVVAFGFAVASGATEAATHQTVNFAVTAKRPEVAEQVGKAAEVYRQQLAIFWLGKPLPNWSRPCKITVKDGALGAGGQTTFQFVRGEVLNWRMEVQGSLERILDSVLPHEINHTIFACHFRRPLPRWADEGAATLFEHRSEQLKQLSLLNEVIRNRQELISLRDLLAMKEYPRGQRPMLTLYAQGYALADFLVQQKGRHAYLKFIADGERTNWEEAIRTNFDHEGIESLERNWQGWVLAGMPKLTLPRDQMLAVNEESPESVSQATARPEIIPAPEAPSLRIRPRRSLDDATVRLQSPDPQRAKSVTTPDVRFETSVEEGTDDVATKENRIKPATIGRDASFVAPVPRAHDATVRKLTDQESPSKDQSLESDVPFRDATADTPDDSTRFSQPEGGSQLEEVEPRRQLERTGAVRFSNTALSAGGSTGKSVDLNGVLLPGERRGNSGSTPQWAGFPGQKKLF
ncbi:MAG: hypothetical protein WKF77_22470 [Planctomycetaceae bacterium]